MADAVEPGTEQAVQKKPKAKKAKKSKKAQRAKKATKQLNSGGKAKFPRHSVTAALRIPRAILDQNAGKACTLKEAAGFLGIKNTGAFQLELSSASKYGLLKRPEGGKVQPSEVAKRILRPQDASDELAGIREAVLQAPDVSEVYQHYRGENLPDDQFFTNALVDKFSLPSDKVSEFKQIFLDDLKAAQLVSEHGDKLRILDVSSEEGSLESGTQQRIEKLGKTVKIEANASCFVVMPFAPPHGDYYTKIYDPAITKAGLKPVRADASIFGTGKIMDQIWSGINAASVLVAELTTRNPNVFYELGLAHALRKPVVLVSSNENDVPFDLQHIRVIYYDVNDPFWGQKLIDKVAENVLSALKNPEEATFHGLPLGS